MYEMDRRLNQWCPCVGRCPVLDTSMGICESCWGGHRTGRVRICPPNSLSTHCHHRILFRRARSLQAEHFAQADVILAPHGAGLTNMIFAEETTQVVELPLKPHVNRCFGYMAHALNLGYWVVPEFRSYYHTKYHNLPPSAVESAARTVMQALRVARGETRGEPQPRIRTDNTENAVFGDSSGFANVLL